MRFLLVGGVLVLGSLGCGGGGGGAGAGRHITWQNDGTTIKAVVTLASRDMQGTSDFLNLLGSNPTAGITIVVSAIGRPLGAETFVCNQTASDQTVSFDYTEADGGTLPATASCTVAVTQVGALNGPSATGTFSAVLNLRNGGPKAITNGSFNVPISM
jgi:hypothetical protein